MTVFQTINAVIGVCAGIVIIFFLVRAYFWPTILAKRNNHPNAGGIQALNLLLGWTFLGWVIALTWAKSYQPTPPSLPQNPVQIQTKTCPKCAEDVKGAALVCRFCGHEFG